jgi:hypothetical protein
MFEGGGGTGRLGHEHILQYRDVQERHLAANVTIHMSLLNEENGVLIDRIEEQVKGKLGVGQAGA